MGLCPILAPFLNQSDYSDTATPVTQRPNQEQSALTTTLNENLLVKSISIFNLKKFNFKFNHIL